VAFVKGLQGGHPKYLKLVATAKHYAVHSGKESERHWFNAVVSQRDLRETYLPAFEACVREGRAVSIMGAYNRTNGEPCCASTTLLGDILRREWGFSGYVVSDCGAIQDIHQHHKVTGSEAESAALAVRNGCDLNCGSTYLALVEAVRTGLLAEADLDTSLRRLFTARFQLGLFDPPEAVPYARIPAAVVGCEQHRKLARRMACASLVLLRNEAGLLPLRQDLKQILVVGPNANAFEPLMGNYNGLPDRFVTPLAGIVRRAGAGTNVVYMKGCELVGPGGGRYDWLLHNARESDVVIAVMGLSPLIEGEEGDAAFSDAGGDRRHIGLPPVQQELLAKLQETGRPVVLVLLNGSPVALNWAAANLPAILVAWYPGQEGGNAIADVLFGDCNPAGRLPLTFVRSLEQLPPFEDYRMKGRTYRFMTDEPLYRFGYGLSYTRFRYSELRLSRNRVRRDQSVRVQVTVENVGDRAGDEVVQLYVRDLEASVPAPLLHLEGFCRVHLRPGQTRRLAFTLTPAQLAVREETGNAVVEPGEFAVSVGGGQPCDPHSGALTVALVVTD
jgi:beta-glucosidase